MEGAQQGDELKSSCGKWETLVKKRVISESNNPAALVQPSLCC